MNDVFILGAGFSKEILDEMPVLAELGEAVRQNLGATLKDVEVLFPDDLELIVPPVLDKLGFFQHETVRELWSKAASELRHATRVFCLGYSFPQTDIGMKFFVESNRPSGKAPFYLANKQVKWRKGEGVR